MTMLLKLPTEGAFTSRLRSAAVAARIGLWLGLCFALAFVTGILSHWAQLPHPPVLFPAAPSWGYRLTQGVHVVAGTMAIPLLLVKLWSVYPKLFAALPKPSRAGALEMLERGSIAVLVASAIFQLASGLANSAQWYPWDFSFRRTHYALAWVAIGALLVHVAVKLPIIRDVLAAPIDDTAHDRTSATRTGPMTRRMLLRTTWIASAAAAVTTAGATVPALRRVSVFGVRDGSGPQHLPVNRSARAAGVTGSAMNPDYALTIVGPAGSRNLTRTELLALPQHTRTLPIACVEGWSANGVWSGVRIRDLLDLVHAPAGQDIQVISLERRGHYGRTILPGNFADDGDTLLALELNGRALALDHGYPARLIAPNRPGVLQTKWVSRLEVLA
jgi:DMSO/TMAO reductase YedYZ molybdopterin-dependent catalytic subunit